MNLISLLAQLTVDPGDLNIPKGDLTNTSTQTVLSLVFGFGGAVAFIIIVVAGLRFVVSRGNPDNATRARNTIIYAVVGLVICAIGYSIVNFVLERLR